MKKTVFFLSLLVGVLIGLKSVAQVMYRNPYFPQNNARVETLQPMGPIDPVPWPWGAELPFPWSFVQGVWVAEHKDFRSYYAFRVMAPSPGRSFTQLEVSQIDPLNCEVTARGAGYEATRVVRAQMNSTSGVVYRLTLRAFHEKSVSSPIPLRPIHNQYVVLSIYPFDTSNAVHIPIQQLTDHLNFKCRVAQ